jgi:hypothetical protein
VALRLHRDDALGSDDDVIDGPAAGVDVVDRDPAVVAKRVRMPPASRSASAPRSQRSIIGNAKRSSSRVPAVTPSSATSNAAVRPRRASKTGVGHDENDDDK